VFGELTAETSLARIEEEVRRFWHRREVPQAFHAAHHDGPPYVICQQPLLAAGGSLANQVLLLATTDLLARFHTMRGSAVRQWTGWICHGLALEVAVERALEQVIADYDLEQFNTACRQAALEGIQHGEALAERLGVWPGPGGAFHSLEPQAVGAVWAALRQLWEVGRLRREQCVASVCTRCATPLSSVEASRRLLEVERHSAWVRLPWEGEPDAYFLVWVPVPWMLVGMVALAVHPEVEYALVELPSGVDLTGGDSESLGRLLLAESALKRTLPGEYRLVRRLNGKALRGARYYPPFTYLPAGKDGGHVLLSEEVPLDRGTGLCPVTPTFDAPSLALAQDHNLPVPQLLDNWGGLDDTAMPWRGLSPLDVEPLLVEELKGRGLLFEERISAQAQAFCPYCEAPLLPLARSVWLVETESGPWIIGRDRAWGVPLPVWICEACGHELCVAGLDDLARRAGLAANQLDPHRPAVDRLTIPCEDCGGSMRRAAPVVDAAFEAAVLSRPDASREGPANLAIGLGDRHLGWPGDLAEVTALTTGALAWEQALALSDEGTEEPWDTKRIHSADALRWATYAGITPDRAEREFLRPLLGLLVSFLNVSDEVPPERVPGGDLLDRWLAARLRQTIGASTHALDAQEPRRAAGELEILLNDLVDWYQLQRPGGGRQVLELLSRLLAPFTPHLAEAIHRQLGGREWPSVHLAPWPTFEPAAEDRVLLTQMSRIRCLARLGQRARAEADIPPLRPVHRAIIGLLVDAHEERTDLAPFAPLLGKLLAAEQVQFTPDARTWVKWRLSLRPGQRLKRDLAVAELEAALAALDTETSAHLASELRAGLSVGLQVSDQAITLLPDQVDISVMASPGWAAAADADHLILLEVG
jgi:isoleucyl-tRNA synthetase